MFLNNLDLDLVFLSLKDFYNQCFLIKLDIYNSLYFLENLPNNFEYIEPFLNLESPFINVEYYKIYLFFKYFDYIKNLYLMDSNNGFWTEYLFLYPLTPNKIILINKEFFSFEIFFSNSFFNNDNFSFFFNLVTVIKTSDLSLVTTNFSKYTLESLNLNKSLLILFLLKYNNFDFEILFHTLVSILYPEVSVLFEDYLLSSYNFLYKELSLAQDSMYFLREPSVSSDACLKDYFVVEVANSANKKNLWFDYTWKSSNDIAYYHQNFYIPSKNLTNNNIQEQFNTYFKDFNKFK